MKKGLKISYNAPISITFSVICVAILLFDYFIAGGKTVPLLFTVPGNAKSPSPFDWSNGLSYIRLFTHVFGHGDWSHLLSNLSFILLLGPLMEERYGSAMIALMLSVTAFVTGVINACFIPTSLMGASGISFMLIILASISTLSKNQLPFSFILLLTVYVVREFITPSASNISTIAHIVGGLCGSLFGFLTETKTERTQKITARKQKKTGVASTSSTSPSYQSQGLTREEMLRRLRQLDENSPRNTAKEEDSTVIGTIQL